MVSSSRRLPGWDLLAAAIPEVVTPMRRYLDQLASILRPGSVSGADLALRLWPGSSSSRRPRSVSSPTSVAGTSRTSGPG
jgi:hypothetical protein